MRYKAIVITLMLFLVLTGMLLWYKEETTNKEVPKRAQFVDNNMDWRQIYG